MILSKAVTALRSLFPTSLRAGAFGPDPSGPKAAALTELADACRVCWLPFMCLHMTINKCKRWPQHIATDRKKAL